MLKKLFSGKVSKYFLELKVSKYFLELNESQNTQPENGKKANNTVVEKPADQNKAETTTQKQAEPDKAEATNKTNTQNEQKESTKTVNTPASTWQPSWEPPFWVKLMYNNGSSPEQAPKQTFATDYLLPTPTKFRRLPGGSLNKFKEMARQAKKPRV